MDSSYCDVNQQCAVYLKQIGFEFSKLLWFDSFNDYIYMSSFRNLLVIHFIGQIYKINNPVIKLWKPSGYIDSR